MVKFAETSDGSEASRATPKGGIPIKERFYLGGQAKAGISGCGTAVRKGRLAGQVDLEILGADVVPPLGPGGSGDRCSGRRGWSPAILMAGNRSLQGDGHEHISNHRGNRPCNMNIQSIYRRYRAEAIVNRTGKRLNSFLLKSRLTSSGPNDIVMDNGT